MPAPTSTTELLDLIQGSGLLDSSRVEAFLAASPDNFDSPRTLAAALVEAELLTPYQADRLLQGRARGFVIADYKILDRLGSGGGGLVFLGEHRRLRHRVAIKILPQSASQDSNVLARFQREARAVANLDHPNIVRAFDVGCLGPIHYLVMEFVDGPNFQALVDESGPLLPSDAAKCVLQAAQALQHMHQAGLIHRDIKPSNLLLDNSGVVKLLDLGLARFCHDQGDRLTSLQGAGVMGSVDYLSPEQARDSHAVDIRTDIYGLGATFYFLLVGRVLFPGATIEQKLLWTQMREPTDVRQLRPEIPEQLAEVLRRLMEKDPRDRYQTPQEVVEALSTWGDVQEPLPSRQDRRDPVAPIPGAGRANDQQAGSEWEEEVSPRPAPRSANGKRWWRLGLALLGFLTLGAGLGFLLWLRATSHPGTGP